MSKHYFLKGFDAGVEAARLKQAAQAQAAQPLAYTEADCLKSEAKWAAQQEPVAYMDADGNVSDNNEYGTFNIPLFTTPPDTQAALKLAMDALKEAAQSLNTISKLAGRKTYGNPPIETYMDDFMQVRGYAASRYGVANDAIAAIKKLEV